MSTTITESTRVSTARTRTEALESDARSQLRSAVASVGPAEAMRVAERVAGDVDRVDLASGPRRAGLSSTRMLRHGARGADVRELQEQLNARGARLELDGIFGRRTENAVRGFQREQGLRMDGIVGPNTRAGFARTAGGGATEGPAPTGPSLSPAQRPILRQGHEGPEVASLQRQLNELSEAGLAVDGDFGPRTRAAVERFQARAELQADGEVGPQTYRALDEVAAGTRELADPAAVIAGPARPSGPRSREITVDGNTFRVHDLVRSEVGRRSVAGNRIIAMDSNSVSGREEVLRPLIVIPNDATPVERRAAQASVDQMAGWLRDNLGGNRAATGVVRTTAENGRGLRGFFHTEFHSVNDSAAVRLIRENPEAYAQIMGETLGEIPGANFIVPHGDPSRWGPDPGAVGRDGTSEVSLARHVIRNGFFALQP